MEQRTLGRTGLRVSVLGYGAGAVGGLMVRGDPAEQARSLALALDAGINYVDTAAIYGDGESERTLGRLLKPMAERPYLGTKVRLGAQGLADIAGTVAASLEASLARLGLDAVDLYQLHDPIGVPGGMSVAQALEEALPAMRRLREQGKCRFLGITALGTTDALRQVLTAGVFDTAQVPYNLLNPTWLAAPVQGLPGQDFARLGEAATAAGVGLIGIRILAAGALSGEAARHPVAMPSVAPIASADDYAADLAHARRLAPLVAQGEAGSLAELAIRFAMTRGEIATALIGTASIGQLEAAIAAVRKGGLPAETLARIAALLPG